MNGAATSFCGVEIGDHNKISSNLIELEIARPATAMLSFQNAPLKFTTKPNMIPKMSNRETSVTSESCCGEGDNHFILNDVVCNKFENSIDQSIDNYITEQAPVALKLQPQWENHLSEICQSNSAFNMVKSNTFQIFGIESDIGHCFRWNF